MIPNEQDLVFSAEWKAMLSCIKEESALVLEMSNKPLPLGLKDLARLKIAEERLRTFRDLCTSALLAASEGRLLAGGALGMSSVIQGPSRDSASDH